MKMGMNIFIDGLALGETAERWFPRTVVVIGGSAANWKTSDEYNWYASTAQLGAMITGRIVYSGEPLFASLAERKKPDDPWHFLNKGTMGPSVAGKRHRQSHRTGLSDGTEGAEWSAFLRSS
jgi:hypothetical protein